MLHITLYTTQTESELRREVERFIAMADPCGCSSSSSTPDRHSTTKTDDTFGIREGEFIRLTDLMTRGDPHEGIVILQIFPVLYCSYIWRHISLHSCVDAAQQKLLHA
jgi:hypothetical protein